MHRAMTRVTRRSTKISQHENTTRSKSVLRPESNLSKSSKKSGSSYSSMDSHPNQTICISQMRKSSYTVEDEPEYFGKSSTGAVLGDSTYLYESDSDKEDELFNPNRSGFRTPDWRARNKGKNEDYLKNVREALCSTGKKKAEKRVETVPRVVTTPHMSTLHSRLVRKASIAAEKEMALIERRVSLKKANESGVRLSGGSDVRTSQSPAGSPAFIDLSKIQPCPKSVEKGTPCRSTPCIDTPSSLLKSQVGVRKHLNVSFEANPQSASPSSCATTPVSVFAGAKRLTVQRASLDMSTILNGVIAFVEVRTNHDNLSQGVKNHLKTLGASIEENFTKKVTHVIFKEGMMSTYKKAEKWRVPLVSALWIEACKSARKIVPAEEYPPIDIERYKNALPFKRFRKKRSVQPISDIRKLPTRGISRKVNRLATTVEEPSSAPAKDTRHILDEISQHLSDDKQIEDKYLKTLLKLAGPFLEEALNRSDSPTNDGDGDLPLLPLSVRLLKKYMTPRASRTDSKFTRVSDLEKHLNLNQKGRSRLRKFLVFTSEDEADEKLADKATQTDDESADDTISPVELPKVWRSSAPARMLTLKKRLRNKTKNVTVKKPSDNVKQKNTIILKPTVIVNKKKDLERNMQSEDKENLNSKNIRSKKSMNKVVPDNKILTNKKKPNSAVKRKILPTDQLIMLDEPNEKLSIGRPLPPMRPPHVQITPKKRKVNEPIPRPESQSSIPKSTGSSNSRYSEMYGLMSSDEDERNSAAWFATPKRNKPLPKPVLVCTSLHTNESEDVISIVSKLGLFEVETKVNAQTTHIVAGGPRRTLNLIKGMARGCWIVRLEWAINSMRAGRWLYEEPYELTEFSTAVREVRILRQSYKFLFSLDIFAPCGSIYVCQKTVPPREDLKEILRLCSAAIVSTAKSAKIVIGKNVSGSLNVQEKWILDCVSQNKLIDTKPYVIKRKDIES